MNLITGDKIIFIESILNYLYTIVIKYQMGEKRKRGKKSQQVVISYIERIHE